MPAVADSGPDRPPGRSAAGPIGAAGGLAESLGRGSAGHGCAGLGVLFALAIDHPRPAVHGAAARQVATVTAFVPLALADVAAALVEAVPGR